LSCEWCGDRDATFQCGECDTRTCEDCWYDHVGECANEVWDNAEKHECRECGMETIICPFCDEAYCTDHAMEHLEGEIEQRRMRIIVERKLGLALL